MTTQSKSPAELRTIVESETYGVLTTVCTWRHWFSGKGFQQNQALEALLPGGNVPACPSLLRVRCIIGRRVCVRSARRHGAIRRMCIRTRHAHLQTTFSVNGIALAVTRFPIDITGCPARCFTALGKTTIPATSLRRGRVRVQSVSLPRIAALIPIKQQETGDRRCRMVW